MWPSSSGPGSINHAGARPTSQVLVPDSVNGPGLAARTHRMSWLRSSRGSAPSSNSAPGGSVVLTSATLVHARRDQGTCAAFGGRGHEPAEAGAMLGDPGVARLSRAREPVRQLDRKSVV